MSSNSALSDMSTYSIKSIKSSQSSEYSQSTQSIQETTRISKDLSNKIISQLIKDHPSLKYSLEGDFSKITNIIQEDISKLNLSQDQDQDQDQELNQIQIQERIKNNKCQETPLDKEIKYLTSAMQSRFDRNFNKYGPVIYKKNFKNNLFKVFIDHPSLKDTHISSCKSCQSFFKSCSNLFFLMEPTKIQKNNVIPAIWPDIYEKDKSNINSYSTFVPAIKAVWDEIRAINKSCYSFGDLFIFSTSNRVIGTRHTYKVINKDENKIINKIINKKISAYSYSSDTEGEEEVVVNINKKKYTHFALIMPNIYRN